MPHYADGTEARVGDNVRGNGYNDTKAKGCVGVVTDVRSGTSCTLTVAYVRMRELDEVGDVLAGRFTNIVTERSPENGQPLASRRMVLTVETEYGDTLGFERVDPCVHPATVG